MPKSFPRASLYGLAFVAGAICQAAFTPKDSAPALDTYSLVILWDDGESDVADSGLSESDCLGAIAEYSPDVRFAGALCEKES